jgi:FRG domain
MTFVRHTAKNLTQYIRLITQITREEQGNTWFRGHSNAAHRLTPSVLRDLTPIADARGNPLKGDEILRSDGYSVTGINPERMLDEFKRRALPFLNFTPRNDFEWLFLMQHHGVPTRLLDWTTHALVALYFAAEYIDPTKKKSEKAAASEFMDGDEFRGDGMAIFCINPRKINRKLHELDNLVDISSQLEKWGAYTRPTEQSSLDTTPPICILAPHISPRIRAQSGTFTLHGSNIWPLDYYTVLQPLIHKIFIPYASSKNIQEELRNIGFTTSFIYPDLDGLSREIKEQELKQYATERINYLTRLDSGR